MAFRAFNFGKQLGIVGGGSSSSEGEPITGHREVPVIDTWIESGGGYWEWGIREFGQAPVGASPLQGGKPGKEATMGWIWNEGPERRRTQSRIVGGAYRPWEAPRVISVVSQELDDDPFWIGNCPDGTEDQCPHWYRDKVKSMLYEILYYEEGSIIFEDFYWILECMRKRVYQLQFGCCPNKPRPATDLTDYEWRKEIIHFGKVWLDPNRFPTRLELIRALTMACDGYDGRQMNNMANDFTAYLLSGETPPCEVLQALVNSTDRSSATLRDKYFVWDPRTGEIFWAGENGAPVGDPVNKGSESAWRCRLLSSGMGGPYYYSCCG